MLAGLVLRRERLRVVVELEALCVTSDGISVIDLLIDYRWNCCPRRVLAEAKTRGGIMVSPAYAYKEMCEYWCSMRINPDLMKLGAHGGPG